MRSSSVKHASSIPNGKFTYKINCLIHFVFFPAEKKNGKEVKLPVWKVFIYESETYMETIYEINGHTGEYKKKQERRLFNDEDVIIID